MGGKAIKKVEISRINKNDYILIKKNIYELLSKDFELDFLFDLPEKEDFGDLDILYLTIHNKNIKDYIIKYFNPNEIVSNGNVISFDYKLNKNNQYIYFQIDLIKTNKLDITKFYFSYGDVGSIIGLIAKKYNLVFGFDGLWINTKLSTIKEYLIKNNNNLDIIENIDSINEENNFGKIVLTNSPEKICEYLDFDYQKWKKGFINNKDIIEWIIKSKYCKKNIFYQTNREHRENIKRSFYKLFMDHVSELDECQINNDVLKLNNNQLEAIKYFNKEDELNNLIEKFKLNNERKDKFNAYIFKELGVEDKKLGENIIKFKKYIIEKYYLYNIENTMKNENENNNLINFEEWIDKNKKEDIKDSIYEFLNF